MSTPNTAPIYSMTPNVSVAAVTASNTNSDGTGTVGTNLFKAYSAGANGSYISVIRLCPVATAAGTATTATVGRIFLSSVTSGTTSPGANTFLVAEYALASQSADNAASATFFIEIPLYKAIPANWVVLATTHAAPAANTYWQVTVYGGDY